jgi:hypothetical protein
MDEYRKRPCTRRTPGVVATAAAANSCVGDAFDAISFRTLHSLVGRIPRKMRGKVISCS